MAYMLLVLGETGAGKTALTEAVAPLLAELAGPGGLTVLDFAPGMMGVGRPMRAPPGARLIRPRGLRAPRLESRGDCRLAWRLAKMNAEATTAALMEYLEEPTPALVINDATIHLHAGDPGVLLKAVATARAALVNAYTGVGLRDECSITEREEEGVRLLMEVAGRVWRL